MAPGATHRPVARSAAVTGASSAAVGSRQRRSSRSAGDGCLRSAASSVSTWFVTSPVANWARQPGRSSGVAASTPPLTSVPTIRISAFRTSFTRRRSASSNPGGATRIRVPPLPAAARTRASSQCATAPGRRTTGSAATSAVISSTEGTSASLSSPAEPSPGSDADDGERP